MRLRLKVRLRVGLTVQCGRGVSARLLFRPPSSVLRPPSCGGTPQAAQAQDRTSVRSSQGVEVGVRVRERAPLRAGHLHALLVQLEERFLPLRASQVDQRQPALGLQLRLSSGLHLLHGQCEQAV